jgi:large subunit ribosomal protein L21
MYAVIETGGKQYRVEVGTELAVELLDVEPGQSITLDRVLLVADGAEASIGRPLVDGASVAAEVLRQDRADKVIAFKYRPKARRRVKKGHRQEQTILRVTDVILGGKSAAETGRKAAADARTERERLEEAAVRQAAEDSALAAKLAAKAEKSAKSSKATETEASAEPAPKKTRAKAAPAEAAAPAEVAAPAEAAAPAETGAAQVEAAPQDAAVPEETAETETAETAESTEAAAPKRSRTKKDE